MPHHRKVMRDKQVSQAKIFLQVFEHVDNLRLDRYIQRADRLVANDKLRLYRQCARDADALLLSAGKLVRKAVAVLRV